MFERVKNNLLDKLKIYLQHLKFLERLCLDLNVPYRLNPSL